MIDGLNGSKNSFWAASNTASPSRTFDPPTQNAVLARPSGPRGKIGSLDDVVQPVRGDRAEAQDDLHVGVVGGDRVERAGMGVGVELNQDRLHRRCH